MQLLDASELEVMRHAFTAVPEQMGAALMKSAFSPNIKERRDESCAIFTKEGGMLAQAEHIPVHLGAMPKALESILEKFDMNENDQVILNDPYQGGTHLPDITLARPVYINGDLLGYVVNRAHHADIGGEVPGSMPGHTERLEEEGIVIPPRKILEGGKFKEEILELLREARSPRERLGDIRAQIGANQKGAEEFKKTVKRVGLEKYKAFINQYFDYCEKRTRNLIEGFEDGVYSYEDKMEWVEGKDVNLSVEIEIDESCMKFDFTGTSEQVKGNINAPLPVVLSAVYYVIKCLLPKEVPLNAGSYSPIDVHVPLGTVLNAEPPAAVSAGNVETSQRVVELILRALQPTIKDIIPAESMGSMNNLAIGNDEFTYYETIGGGSGASPKGNGESGIHVHMTNTMNTPIEALENSYPLRITSYRLRKNSGGRGKFDGGDGVVREIKIMQDSHVSIQSERRKYPPKGSEGGCNGCIGKNFLISDERKNKLPGKISVSVKSGDLVRIETPGGGGWGRGKE